ncbi:MAG: cytochrome b [Halochromatium sp.]|uniref:cytochrome b n=1 Tax=Halochromatium sp. TaxID=2049430 RepID=UPI00397D9B39
MSVETVDTAPRGFLGWLDKRFPVMAVWNDHMAQYYAPKNMGLWSIFGSLALVVLIIQIVSGLWLAMSYKPAAADAFASVEYIMRDVNWGWLLRYIHSTGASFFFILVYLHMFRGLMWGSYKSPRELLWIIGVVIYLAMMATAFFGYLLPWGQMSYWGAQVIVNLFAAVPEIGTDLSTWVRGDYVISDATLNRFYAFHFVIPFLLVGLVFVHIVALHRVGSTNPDGIEIKNGPKGNKWDPNQPADGIPFHPYYTVKDITGLVVFLAIFSAVVFYAPDLGGLFLEPPNFQPADPLKTPEHIAPVWYFTPFYAMLRAVPTIAGSQFPGVVVMFGAILILFLLPWLDRSPVRSMRYKGVLSRFFLGAFAVSFVVLAYLGLMPSTELYTLLAQIFTVVYFAFFLLMPIYTKLEKTKPVPERVTS